jgi:hypothetical protein
VLPGPGIIVRGDRLGVTGAITTRHLPSS